MSRRSSSKPYASSFSSRGYKRKYYSEEDEVDFYHNFYFSPPSRALLKVKPFRDKPVVNLTKGAQFFSLTSQEFYDLMPMMGEIDDKLKLCKEKIAENAKRKKRRHHSGEADFKQIPISERSKKEAEELARIVDDGTSSISDGESDG